MFEVQPIRGLDLLRQRQALAGVFDLEYWNEPQRQRHDHGQGDDHEGQAAGPPTSWLAGVAKGLGLPVEGGGSWPFRHAVIVALGASRTALNTKLRCHRKRHTLITTVTFVTKSVTPGRQCLQSAADST